MTVDKDVPFPGVANLAEQSPTPYKGLGGRMSSYPFMEMEIGDSVFFESQSASGPAYSIAKKYAVRSGCRKFSGRKVDGGFRIWRVA